ncbi:MAG: type I-C CRISPR-associated protein Cas8c/Csd1 [Syntrophothermus sp.]|uniref:type I-C CRISPR-associated protein Cas8c/Csd1 n=1 Tax=Syntrophothermus sp. TaxID=2736299 RepID=UPI00257D424D|nr:type I-C CRISPR-associated protein Cas8c/Csd1 [Syntrophothermus sp.]NSW83324.1 type I-C CRISPR-associated protein Cas8c/Csd1 [Syntrophothermus sp.]
MLKELVDKAEKLEREGKKNPIGYDRYSEPVKWVVHIYPDEKRIEIEEYSGENRARPKPANRTSNVYPCPLADEATYVLGINRISQEKVDKKATAKHQAYKAMLEQIALSPHIEDELLREAVTRVSQLVEDGSVAKAFGKRDVLGKQWITFVYETGHLRGKHLHEMPQIKEFWARKVSGDVASNAEQPCCICGRRERIVRNIPTKIVLKSGNRQIASFNKSAFVSFSFSEKGAPVGMCVPCAENASQALNYLVQHNSQVIYEDRTAKGKVNNDSPRNQVAVFWLKEDMKLSLEGQEISCEELFAMPIVMPESMGVTTTEEVIDRFLKAPWGTGADVLNLDENTFYLAVLSPNTGRIAVRDWIEVGAGQVKANLAKYFEALRLVDAAGNKRAPYSISQLLAPLPDADPGMAKSLIRCAYRGEQPPPSLLLSAVRRLRVSGARDGGLEEKKRDKRGLEPVEVWQRLCALIKFCLTFGKEDAQEMETLQRNRQDSAYQAGRLLAVLEEIQKRAAGSTLSSTLVDRYYGSASTSPATVFPLLISMATKAHMPKIRKKYFNVYRELEALLEEIMLAIDELGGFPQTLPVSQQGEFSLGFYHQRAYFAAERANK